MLFQSSVSVAGLVALAGSAVATPLEPRGPPSGDFKAIMIKGHDWYRSQHQADNLKWNDEAAKNAQSWVNNCKFEHQKNNKFGENLAAGGLSSWDQVVNMWGGERTKYNYNNPGFSSATGHFTQVVWKKTTSFGCAYKSCPGSTGTLVACEYSPPGNIVGNNNQYFKDNVKPQTKGKPSDTFHS